MLSPDLATGLRERTYDLALLRPGSGPLAGLAVRAVRRDRLVVALPPGHRLARRRRIDVAELADEPFVTHPSDNRSAMYAAVLEACRAAGFVPHVVGEAAETATLMVLVAAGQGVALVPEPVRSLGVEKVSYVSLTAAPTLELALAHRDGDLSPAAERVAAIAADCLR